jgi:hypothetical protein
MDNNETTTVKEKAVDVPADVLKEFKKHVASFRTKKQCLKWYGIKNYSTLRDVQVLGSCAPETLDKINDGLERLKKVA